MGIKFFSYPCRAQCARDLFACRLQRVVAGIPCCGGGGREDKIERGWRRKGCEGNGGGIEMDNY